MGPRTQGRASPGRVNVWSLLYILREINYYWNAKWTMKRSLHHWERVIIIVVYFRLVVHTDAIISTRAQKNG